MFDLTNFVGLLLVLVFVKSFSDLEEYDDLNGDRQPCMEKDLNIFAHALAQAGIIILRSGTGWH